MERDAVTEGLQGSSQGSVDHRNLGLVPPAAARAERKAEHGGREEHRLLLDGKNLKPGMGDQIERKCSGLGPRGARGGV